MMPIALSVLRERKLSGETRGLDYYDPMDLLALTHGCSIKLIRNMGKRTPIENIDSQHGYPTIASFNINYKNRQNISETPSHVLVADNEGPVDIYDIQKKTLLRSYLEHGSRVTGLTWYDWYEKQSFISCSADGTVRLYDLTNCHSRLCLNLSASTCGVHISPFSPHLIAFGTTKGKFYIYDIRNTSSPFIEAKAHLKTVSNTLFVSEFELLTIGTDNTAKLWDLNRTVCTTTFEDNTHESCFVGVDSFSDFVALGGENNFVLIYTKYASKSIITKALHPSSTYVCGCVLVPKDESIQLIAAGNQDHLVYFQLDIVEH